jgi:HD domain
MTDQTSVDIRNVVQLILEIDKLKGVLRKVRPVGEDRYENTAEHSWQIGVFALSLARTLGITMDISRVISMLLVHDIGEIDAGDRFVFAQDGWGRAQSRGTEGGREDLLASTRANCSLSCGALERVRCRGDDGGTFCQGHRPQYARSLEPLESRRKLARK